MALSTLGSGRIREFQDSVFPPLKSCIKSIKCVIDIVLQQADQAGVQQQYDSIRLNIVRARDHAFDAERAAQSKLKTTNSYYANLIIQQSTTKSRRDIMTAELNAKLSNLQAEKCALESSICQMNAASTDMANSRQRLRELNDRMSSDATTTAVGICAIALGFFFPPALPVLAAGGGMLVAVSQADLAEAKSKAEQSERDLGEATKRYQACSTKISNLEVRVSQLNREIKEANSRLASIDCETGAASSLLRSIADLQPSFNHATTKLGEIAGSANVLEVTTRHFVWLEPLMMNLEEIAKKMVQLFGNEQYKMLLEQDIAPLITSLNENSARLLAISNQGPVPRKRKLESLLHGVEDESPPPAKKILTLA